MSGAVRNLRVVPRPYDHEVDEDTISVDLSPIAWALIHQACRTSPITAVRDAGEMVAAQVRAVNAARAADYRDGA